MTQSGDGSEVTAEEYVLTACDRKAWNIAKCAYLGK
jgi:hypothetical protein